MKQFVTKFGKLPIICALSALVLASLACGSIQVQQLPQQGGLPDIQEVEPIESVNLGDETLISITNDSGADICYLFIADAAASDWGEDILGAKDIIADGATVEYSIPANITYDLRADNCSEETVEELDDVYLPATENANWVIDGADGRNEDQAAAATAGTAELIVVNGTDDTICYLYIAEKTSPDWGADVLGEEGVTSGGQVTFEIDADVEYEALAQNCDQGTLSEVDSLVLGDGEAGEWTVGE